MKLFIASDHAGFEMKKDLAGYLRNDLGYDVTDLGPHELDPEDDYPDTLKPLVKAILEDKEARGIALGGGGHGEAMYPNRFKGIRAATFNGGSFEVVKLSREHNDANILALGARLIDGETAKKAVKIWLETPFTGEERHVRRLKKLDI